MNCWRTRQLLTAFLDGELSPSENELVEQHVSSCDECSTALERLDAVPPMELPRLPPQQEQEIWQRMDAALDQAWERQAEPVRESSLGAALHEIRRWFGGGSVAVPIPVAAVYMVLIVGLTGLALHSYYRVQDLHGELRAAMAETPAPASPVMAPAGPNAFTASVSLPLDARPDEEPTPEELPQLGRPVHDIIPVYDNTGAIVYTVDHGYPIEY